jgi:hypothetical protein
MNAYKDMLAELAAGTNHFVIALLSAFYYIINAAGMTAENLADIMTKLGYTYNTSTNVLNDGIKDYSVAAQIEYALNSFYPTSKPLNPTTMLCMIIVCYRKSLITSTEKATLIGLLK